MIVGKLTLKLLLGTALLWLAAGVTAGEYPRITEPSDLDRRYMTQQRESLNDLAAMKLGRHFSGQKDNDLQILQLLLDKRLVRPDQTMELQSMGIIMGDLLAAELGMHWVIYEDAQGRSRALRYQQSDEYLFPVTMISRRQEVDNHTPVAVIYQTAMGRMGRRRPAIPFR